MVIISGTPPTNWVIGVNVIKDQVNFYRLSILLIAFVSVWSSAYQAMAEDTGTKLRPRQLVFPSQFSLGKLYSYEDPDNDSLILHGQSIVHKGHYMGEAQGAVPLPASQKTLIYLNATYQLLEHPEALTKIAPVGIDCISFGTLPLFGPIERTFPSLAHLTGMRRVELKGAELSDHDLTFLKSLPNLESLNVAGCGVNGTFLKDMPWMSKLKDLDISHNPLDPSVYFYLARCKNLRWLSISRCGENDVAIEELSKLQNLERLFLSQSKISAKSMPFLKRMKGLRHLDLSGTVLSAKDLAALQGAKLTELILPVHKYSLAEMKLLKNALPSTELSMNSQKVDSETDALCAPLH